jgi:ribosomal protein S18 acetylase RimI-like enzyme
MENFLIANNTSVSTDKNKLDIVRIYNYISNQSYWGIGRTMEQVKTTVDQSICFGVYVNDEQVAFARVVSDTIAFAYLLDVIVFPKYRKCGYSKLLMQSIIEHENLQTVSWLLRTDDAQKLYEKFGFSTIETPENFMRK